MNYRRKLLRDQWILEDIDEEEALEQNVSIAHQWAEGERGSNVSNKYLKITNAVNREEDDY